MIGLREQAKKEILRVLSTFQGRKDLIIDQSLKLLVSFFLDFEATKFHQQYELDLLNLEPGHILDVDAQSIFLIRPTVSSLKCVAQVMKASRGKGATAEKKRKPPIVWLMPRKTIVCEKVLVEEGVYGDVKLLELPIELVQFETDVLSMEMPICYRQSFLDGDPSIAMDAARALMKLQLMFGIIPNIKGKGNLSWRVWQLMNRLRAEGGQSFSSKTSTLAPQIDTLILIDRSADPLTPLLYQQTYEGLADELYGIECTVLEYDDTSASPPKRSRTLLNSRDLIHGEIRGMHVRAMASVLKQKTVTIRQVLDKGKEILDTKAGQPTDLIEFRRQVQEINIHNKMRTQVEVHLNLADKLLAELKTLRREYQLTLERLMVLGDDRSDCEDQLESCIARQDPWLETLRLLCLLSQTGTVKPKRLDQLKREFIHTYGFHHIVTLDNLERMDLLLRNKKPIFPTLAKKLDLVVTDSAKADALISNPTSIAYTYGGYAPLSVRLVELAQNKAWKRLEEWMNMIPGKTFEERQELPAHLQDRVRGAGYVAPSASTPTSTSASSPIESKAAGTATSAAAGASASTASSKPITLVFFLGGVTYSEIAAIRHLSSRASHGKDYLIATTHLMNGSSMLDAVAMHTVSGGGARGPAA